MRIFRISKGNGKYRTIYAPNYEEKCQYRALLRRLAPLEREAAREAGTFDVAHGFVRGRSVVTMAHYHKRGLVTVSLDIKSWYDSVRPNQIAGGLAFAGLTADDADEYAQRCCHTGLNVHYALPEPPLAPRQGLPSSPVAANLAAVPLDRWLLDNLPAGSVYTRYADDMVVSLTDTDAREAVDNVIAVVTRGVFCMGWEVDPKKTDIQRSRQGRRLICGLTVDACGVHAPRRTRRRLRAARHQRNRNQANGLREWCACKLPNLEKGAAVEQAWQIRSEGSPEALQVAGDVLEQAGLYGLANRCRAGDWHKKHA